MGYPHKPHPQETVLLSQYFGDAGAKSVGGWKQRGGYRALDQALGMTREQIVEEMEPHLCRCSAYKRIIEAIEIASRRA